MPETVLSVSFGMGGQNAADDFEEVLTTDYTDEDGLGIEGSRALDNRGDGLSRARAGERIRRRGGEAFLTGRNEEVLASLRKNCGAHVCCRRSHGRECCQMLLTSS